MSKTPKQCMTCGGTGWQWLDNSWMATDGQRREQCGICGGSGLSDYHNHDALFVRRQAKHREARAQTSHNKMLVSRIKGVAAQPATAASQSDPQNPNVGG